MLKAYHPTPDGAPRQPILWNQPHQLREGRWVPATPIANAVVRGQHQRGNPVLAPWTE